MNTTIIGAGLKNTSRQKFSEPTFGITKEQLDPRRLFCVLDKIKAKVVMMVTVFNLR